MPHQVNGVTNPGAAALARQRGTASPAWLFIVDVVALTAAFTLAYVMRYEWKWFAPVGYEAGIDDYLPIFALYIILFPLMFRLDGVYSAARRNHWFDQSYHILNGGLKALVILLAVIFFYRPLVYSRLMLVEAGVLAILFCALIRLVYRLVKAVRIRAGEGVANVLIVGAGEVGRAVMRVIVARPELGLRCVGFVDDDVERGSTSIGRFEALGNCDRVPEILASQRIDEMVITLPWSAQKRIAWLVAMCNHHGVRARVAPSNLQLNLDRIDVEDYGGIPLLTASQQAISVGDQVVKRIIDIVLSLLMLTLAVPVILLCALLIRLESPGFPIFAQTRIGKGGKPFTLYKLRSMRSDAEQVKAELMAQNEADGPLFKMRNDPRMTRIGKFIRRTSIDELTQFWNVLKGEMSIVGPRPHVPAEVEKYLDWHRPRLAFKPGITGLPQISGRSELAFDETVLLDLYYIENWSNSLDMRIILRTPVYLLTARGAY